MEKKSSYQRVKKHFKDNKKTYICCVVTAASTAVVVLFASKQGTSNVTAKQFSLSGNNVATIINIDKPGNSGNVVMDPSTLQTWLSQNKVAQELGKSRAEIQRMIKEGELVKIQDGSVAQLSVV